MFTLKILILILPTLATAPQSFGVAHVKDTFATRAECEERGRVMAPEVGKVISAMLRNAQAPATLYGTEPVCTAVGASI